jgi:S1-C subfamily serine protease
MLFVGDVVQRAIFAALSLAVLPAPSYPQQPAAISRFPDNYRGAVVRIDGPSSAGFGFYFQPGLIATCEHIVHGAAAVDVSAIEDGSGAPTTPHRAPVVGRDDHTGLAIIRLEGTAPFIPVERGDPPPLGTALSAVGEDGRGTASGVAWEEGRIKQSATSVWGAFGEIEPAACGPVLDANARFVGMLVARLRPKDGKVSDGRNIQFALAADEMAHALPMLVAEGRVRYGTTGTIFANQDGSAVGSNTNARVVVNTVTPGRAASRAGLKEGDVVVSWNNRPAVNVEDLVRDIGWTSPGEVAEMRVLRDGRELIFQIEVELRPGSVVQQ